MVASGGKFDYRLCLQRFLQWVWGGLTIDIIDYGKRGAELRLRFFAENADLIIRAATMIKEAFNSGGKLLIFGNGGSAADAQHLAAEMINRYRRERPPLAAIALTTDSSNLTSIGNDRSFEEIFSRQIQALGRKGDVALAISTSGNSPNVLEGITACKKAGLKVIGLTGRDGGRMAGSCDLALIVSSEDTPLVQEVHLAIEHVICELIDEAFSTEAEAKSTDK